MNEVKTYLFERTIDGKKYGGEVPVTSEEDAKDVLEDMFVRGSGVFCGELVGEVSGLTARQVMDFIIRNYLIEAVDKGVILWKPSAEEQLEALMNTCVDQETKEIE